MKRTSKKKKLKPAWERAYQGHVLWLGKQKLGKVTLLVAHNLDPRGKYKWEAGGRAGYADELAKAKSAVELAAHAADKQLDLFK
ncbi:MAG TPA: hypothetical protein VFB93_15805 [Burkholderiales bacterium]|nr:hypothetical protein [Burkholderiales bacterium]